MNTTPSSIPRPDSTRAAGARALVLGGGGSAGNAWELGVVAGLFDAGLDLTEAELIIGTSAGSTVAAQITGASPIELLDAILTAVPQQRTAPAGVGGARAPGRPAGDHLERTNRIIAAASDAADMRRRMGAAALELDAASDGSAGAQWRAIVAARLPSQRWPERMMLITAVDARTGKVAWSQLVGTGPLFNNFYAPVTIGPDGTLYVGTLGGFVAVRGPLTTAKASAGSTTTPATHHPVTRPTAHPGAHASSGSLAATGLDAGIAGLALLLLVVAAAVHRSRRCTEAVSR